MQTVAMSCDVQSPWGEIRFEALTGSEGYCVQLTRDGQVLAADWVAKGSDVLAKWQHVRESLGAAAADSPKSTDVAGGPWWGAPPQLPASVAIALGR